ncbi:MAG: agmatine deiminase family protein, partial [Acidimicrobiia bacterium]|nr:agmatine deiminase family protein [Acidimicrobiia bacterium]
RATWLAWPHHEPDWPGKFGAIPWVYAEIVRVLARAEPVEVLCQSVEAVEAAGAILRAHAVDERRVRLHVVPTDRVWLRDSAPTGVLDAQGRPAFVGWAFNAWAKYDNFAEDLNVGAAVARIAGLPLHTPARDGTRIVLEGGGIEVNGAGLVMVTEEWLLSDTQVRNPGFGRADYETVFADWLGATRTIWLGEGCVGDDTHGHVDDVARFVSADTVVLAFEPDPADENHRRSVDNLRRLQTDAASRALRVVRLPYPGAVVMDGVRLPASYANFYVANGVVLVPTFNDPSDRRALTVLAELMPDRTVVGIHAVDLVWGLGTLHCLTQQEPRGASQGVSPPAWRRSSRAPS